ncbi:MAG: formylglycine-generating enzyme family protein [Moorea sp. SIO3A2]|nr:formylglycine-generating enzyme family protein [Moorena sp. SIO3A2]
MKQMQKAYQDCLADKLLDNPRYEIPDSLDIILSILDDKYQVNYQETLIVEFVVGLLKNEKIQKQIIDKLKEWIKRNAKNPSDLLTNKKLTKKVNSDTQHNSSQNAQILSKFLQQSRDWFVRLVGQLLGSKKPNLANASNFKQFSFEVVTVNRKGEIIKRESQQARYFNQDLGNGVDLEMVYIPAGSFLMGSPESEKESDDSERPQHQVSVQPFFLGKYQVTQGQWRAVANLPKIKRDLDPDPSHFKGDNRPVEQVNWLDAVEFCERLSDYTGTEYRLPSEAEWEYACRAGTTTPFHYGETITSKLANYNASHTYAEEARGSSQRKTTEVGRFPPNGFGLYDMHGNVWEWCADPCHDNYKGAPTDGSVWSNRFNPLNYRIMRGGSWKTLPSECRSAFRSDYFNVRFFPFVKVGFRVARSVGSS